MRWMTWRTMSSRPYGGEGTAGDGGGGDGDGGGRGQGRCGSIATDECAVGHDWWRGLDIAEEAWWGRAPRVPHRSRTVPNRYRTVPNRSRTVPQRSRKDVRRNPVLYD